MWISLSQCNMETGELHPLHQTTMQSWKKYKQCSSGNTKLHSAWVHNTRAQCGTIEGLCKAMREPKTQMLEWACSYLIGSRVSRLSPMSSYKTRTAQGQVTYNYYRSPLCQLECMYWDKNLKSTYHGMTVFHYKMSYIAGPIILGDEYRTTLEELSSQYIQTHWIDFYRELVSKISGLDSRTYMKHRLSLYSSNNTGYHTTVAITQAITLL